MNRTCTFCKKSKNLKFFSTEDLEISTKCSKCLHLLDSVSSLGYETEKKLSVRSYKLKKYWPEATPAECLRNYTKMFAAQNGVCAVCACPEAGKTLAVDHDKETLKVRSLLCQNCNQSLGKLKEDFDTVLNLAKYIQEHKGTI